MPRTIVVVYAGARVWGGIETYLHNLFRFHDPETMRLVLVSLGEWELERAIADGAVPAGETHWRLSGRRVRPRTILEIRKVVKEEKADLVLSQGAVANAYARVAARFSGVPNLVVTHSELANDYPRALKRWGFTLSDRLLRPFTKRYIAVSWYLRGELVRSGVKADRIAVVYNGVDIRGLGIAEVTPPPDGALPPDGAPLTVEHAMSGKFREVNLVSVGRLHRVKNFDALIRAASLLPENTRLTIWGDGTEREDLERLTDSLGLRGRVMLPGRAESIPAVLAKADVYVQPSKSEGFGLAVVEAMLCRRPVVVAPHGSLPELVEDGVTGIVAADSRPQALAASILRVVCDDDLASRVAAAGQEAARRRFSIDRWLEATAAAFAEASG
jgi:glycosyltransferase involved in cell wall biosynthesis